MQTNVLNKFRVKKLKKNGLKTFRVQKFRVKK